MTLIRGGIPPGKAARRVGLGRSTPCRELALMPDARRQPAWRTPRRKLPRVPWVLNNALVTAAIAGPRTERHWDAYVRAPDYRFTAEDEALADGLVTEGHASTPGLNDPGHPLEGRKPRTGGAADADEQPAIRAPAARAA